MQKPARQQGRNIGYGPPEQSETVAPVVEMFLTTKGEKQKIGNRAAEPREPIAAVLSNQFGVFAFEPVLPCSAYTVTARHRFFSFGAPAQIEPKDFPPDGSGIAVHFQSVYGNLMFTPESRKASVCSVCTEEVWTLYSERIDRLSRTKPRVAI